jgi:hypothetical protein
VIYPFLIFDENSIHATRCVNLCLLSESTVKTYVSRILDKTNRSNRVQLAMLAWTALDEPEDDHNDQPTIDAPPSRGVPVNVRLTGGLHTANAFDFDFVHGRPHDQLLKLEYARSTKHEWACLTDSAALTRRGDQRPLPARLLIAQQAICLLLEPSAQLHARRCSLAPSRVFHNCLQRSDAPRSASFANSPLTQSRKWRESTASK